jgi:hypothetical protein
MGRVTIWYNETIKVSVFSFSVYGKTFIQRKKEKRNSHEKSIICNSTG